MVYVHARTHAESVIECESYDGSVLTDIIKTKLWNWCAQQLIDKNAFHCIYSFVLIPKYTHTQYAPLYSCDYCLVRRFQSIEFNRSGLGFVRVCSFIHRHKKRKAIHKQSLIHKWMFCHRVIFNTNRWISLTDDEFAGDVRATLSLSCFVSIFLFSLLNWWFCVSIWCDAAIDFKLLMWLTFKYF